jgi:hypothetical protein
MSGFIYGLPETFCTFANNRLLGSYWLFYNRNWFTPFGESVPISPPADINSYACSSRRRIRLQADVIIDRIAKTLLHPRYRSVVCIETWPSRNWI